MPVPQKTVNSAPNPGIAGEFCSANPYYSLLAGEGRLVAGPLGVVQGKFAWADANGIVTQAHPGTAGARLGFVPRDNSGLITAFPFTAGLTIQPGFEVTLFRAADVWMLFPAGATIAQSVYANIATGDAVSATAVATATFTANTTSGSPNLAAVSTQVFAGEPVSGAGIPADTTILTGAIAGGTAVMTANATATATGVTVTRTTTVLTEWRTGETVAAGEVAKTGVKG